MSRRIPVQLEARPEVAIDAGVVARALDLDVDRFRQLMDTGKISVLCERGIGEDAGLYRATFYFERRRARLVVDDAGHVVGVVER